MRDRTLGGVSRRTFLAGASLGALAIYQRSIFGKDAVEPAIVKTSMGAVRGEAANGVRMFRGIPFCEPPVGPLRFRLPEKIKSWDGELDATKFKASPMQAGEQGVTHSEDCLGLNIWAPTSGGPYPVFVWIHGGGFTAGHAFDPGLDGAQFVRDGIVVVTVPYRLGIFGFLDVSPLLRSSYAGSSNNAVRDLIASLEWIRDNIEAFGGDPGRVTIGGESAGGKLTSTLMGVPSAQPLFQQMISSSGGAERVWTTEQATFVGNHFGELWKKTGDRDYSTLLTAPATELADAQKQLLADWPKELAMQIPFRPEIDSELFPKSPIENIAAGSTRGKRFLVGSNLDESAVFIGPHPKEVIQPNVGNVALAKFNEIYAHYKTLYPKLNDEQLRIRAVSAQAYWVPSIRVADAHAKASGKTFMYRLDFLEASGRLQGYAFHGLDVGLVWKKPRKDVTNADAEARLSSQMHQAWVAFIRGETPAAAGLPEWTEYHPDTRDTMLLNANSQMKQKPHEAELRLWGGVL